VQSSRTTEAWAAHVSTEDEHYGRQNPNVPAAPKEGPQGRSVRRGGRTPGVPRPVGHRAGKACLRQDSCRRPRAVQIPDRLASASCGSVCGGRRQLSSIVSVRLFGRRHAA